MEPVTTALIIKGIVWLGTMVAAAYAVKKVTGVFGSTPANDLKQQIPQLERMTPKELYQDRKDWQKDRIKYHKKKGKQIQDEIDKLNRKIELENEEKNRLLQMKNNTDDPAEKAKIQQKIAVIDKNIGEFQKKINDLNKNKGKNEEKIDEVYGKFDDNLTQEQFVNQATSINWTSYKNYAIMFIAVIVIIMIIGVVKKLFSSLLSSVK